MGKDREELSRKLNKMVSDLDEGRLPLHEVMNCADTVLEKDYFGYVNHARAAMALMRHPRVLERLLQEMTEELARVQGRRGGVSEIHADVRAKDGLRLFDKLERTQKEVFGGTPSLLTGSTFDECLGQYQSITDHVERLWHDSCDLYRRGHYPHSTFIAILVIEEIGKLGRLWWDLLTYDKPKDKSAMRQGVPLNHRKKHFMGVISGAVINARLDRILGIKAVKTLLQDADSGKLEKLRQSCLYIDYEGGRIATPTDRVGPDKAGFLVVLAGELMADLLGHFPWEFERILRDVTEFEVEIGFLHDVVERGGKVDA